VGYKSWSHLSRGAKGTAQQVAQREAALAKRKKKTKKVWGRFEKEKEINRWLHSGERRDEVEEEPSHRTPWSQVMMRVPQRTREMRVLP